MGGEARPAPVIAIKPPILDRPMQAIDEEIFRVEAETILGQFRELKEKGAGELKVAVQRDVDTGEPRIVFCGITTKDNLDRLRSLYAKRGRTF